MSSTSISISETLRETEQLFSETGIPTPRLDAEVLLAHVLRVTRPYLHAHGKDELESEKVRTLESSIQRRLKREPIAYIVGKKEFYSREFIVTPNVLIPRPETEELIEMALELGSKKVRKLESKYESRDTSHESRETQGVENLQSLSLKKAGPFTGRDFASLKVIDVGTGSGCVGITLKLERPTWSVTLADVSPKALSVAQKNAMHHGADVQIVESDLLSRFLPSKIHNLKSKIFFDLIVANLPYVDKTWEMSPETKYEPNLALYAEDNGLKLIKKLIEQSSNVLNKQGLLLLEADPEQHPAITEAATSCGFTLIEARGYALGFTKLTQA